jgi:hypothetical protein
VKFLYVRLKVDSYTVKKGELFSRPQPGCHLPKSPWTGIIKLFPSRETLVIDIPAGERENGKPIFTVYYLYLW